MDSFVSFSVPPAVVAVEWLHKPLFFTAYCIRTFSLLLSHADLSNLVSLSVPYKSGFLDHTFQWLAQLFLTLLQFYT